VQVICATALPISNKAYMRPLLTCQHPVAVLNAVPATCITQEQHPWLFLLPIATHSSWACLPFPCHLCPATGVVGVLLLAAAGPLADQHRLAPGLPAVLCTGAGTAGRDVLGGGVAAAVGSGSGVVGCGQVGRRGG
jgi:hypothetical protein